MCRSSAVTIARWKARPVNAIDREPTGDIEVSQICTSNGGPIRTNFHNDSQKLTCSIYPTPYFYIVWVHNV